MPEQNVQTSVGSATKPSKPKSEKWIIWVGVVCGVLLLGGGGYWFFAIKGKDQTAEQEGTETPAAEDGGEDEEDTANGGEQEEPKDVLKGFWVPYMNGAGGPGSSFDPVIAWAKGHGANTLVFPIDFSPHVGGSYLNQLPEGRRESISGTIQKAHDEGLEVWIVVTNVGNETLTLDEIDLDELNEYIIEIAIIAEANNVEYFEPFGEPSGTFQDFWPYVPPYNEGREDEKLAGEPAVNEWAQEILAEVRKVYTGIVVYEEDLSPFLYYTQFGECPIDFSGYDYLAFGITPREFTTIEEYPEFVEDFFDAALAMAERDGIEKVMVREFGVWEWDEDEHSDEEILEAHRIVLEKFQEKNLDGIFVLVPPEWGELEGFDETLMIDLIEEWYKEILK